jgi:hypothetical protein
MPLGFKGLTDALLTAFFPWASSVTVIKIIKSSVMLFSLYFPLMNVLHYLNIKFTSFYHTRFLVWF